MFAVSRYAIAPIPISRHRLAVAEAALLVTLVLAPLRYHSINANELLSPLQFGQATRLVVVGDNAFLITGVTSPHLADDVFTFAS